MKRWVNPFLSMCNLSFWSFRVYVMAERFLYFPSIVCHVRFIHTFAAHLQCILSTNAEYEMSVHSHGLYVTVDRISHTVREGETNWLMLTHNIVRWMPDAVSILKAIAVVFVGAPFFACLFYVYFYTLTLIRTQTELNDKCFESDWW